MFEETLADAQQARDSNEPMRAPVLESVAASLPGLPETAPPGTVLRLRLPGKPGLMLLSMLGDANRGAKRFPNLFWDKKAQRLSSYLYMGESLIEIQLHASAFLIDFPSKAESSGGVIFDDFSPEAMRRLQESHRRAVESRGQSEPKGKAPRYVDFRIEMKEDDPRHDGHGTLYITMSGGGNVETEANWFKIVMTDSTLVRECKSLIDANPEKYKVSKDDAIHENAAYWVAVRALYGSKDGDIDANYQIYPVMTWLQAQKQLNDVAMKKATVKLDEARTNVEKAEAKKVIEAVPEYKWAVNGGFSSEALIDAVYYSKHQVQVKQFDEYPFFGLTVKDPALVEFKLSVRGEGIYPLQSTKLKPWKADVTGIDVPVKRGDYGRAFFDLYTFDQIVTMPLSIFTRRWRSAPDVFTILGGEDNPETPAILIYPVGSRSWIVTVIANEAQKVKKE